MNGIANVQTYQAKRGENRIDVMIDDCQFLTRIVNRPIFTPSLIHCGKSDPHHCHTYDS